MEPRLLQASICWMRWTGLLLCIAGLVVTYYVTSILGVNAIAIPPADFKWIILSITLGGGGLILLLYTLLAQTVYQARLAWKMRGKKNIAKEENPVIKAKKKMALFGFIMSVVFLVFCNIWGEPALDNTTDMKLLALESMLEGAFIGIFAYGVLSLVFGRLNTKEK